MIYFRGCTAREKQTNIADATEKLLKSADVEYRVLEDEACCGSVLLRTGFVDDAKKQIEKNTEVLKDELILTSCAGCYKTLTQDYNGLNVVHITEFLEKLIKNNDLKFNKKDLNVTYHDSCHLARHCEIYDSPRNVIKSVSNIVEMENIKENSLCCGAGGGVKSAYPHIAGEIAKSRLKQAYDTNCELLITACPFCKINLDNDRIDVLDITEFLIKYGDLDESQ